MHESGFMEELDQKWILLNEQVCSIRTEHFPPTLGLKNMAGVFILVATGILGGVGLIMFEIFYKRHQTRKQKRLELARNALDRWKEMVQVIFFCFIKIDQFNSNNCPLFLFQETQIEKRITEIGCTTTIS